MVRKKQKICIMNNFYKLLKNYRGELCSSEKIAYNKGITLIALVITIVVMLILAGVGITFFVNGDLFGQAMGATQDAEIAITKQQIQEEITVKQRLSKPYNSIKRNSLEDILKIYSKPQENYSIIDPKTRQSTAITDGIVTVVVNKDKNGNGPVIIENVKIGGILAGESEESGRIPNSELEEAFIYVMQMPEDDLTYTIGLDRGDFIYDFIVDWGDGVTSEVKSQADTNKSHTYATSGEYIVTIKGIAQGAIRFGYFLSRGISIDTNINRVSTVYECNTRRFF